jgi:ubiquinone/menaquinone biosynthesis C-methylase UbiE
MGHEPGHKSFIPGLGYHRLTAFYDPVVALLLREGTWKAALVEDVAPKPGERILDLGCGTGTLAVLIKTAEPEAKVFGLDPDPAMLERGAAKADRAGVRISFERRFADELGAPEDPESCYDKVVSSLMFHHLDSEAKRRALKGIMAWLRPGGTLHIADWGRPQNLLMRCLFLTVQLDDGFAATRDNVLGRLPVLMCDAGFEEVAETRRYATALGSLSFYRGRKSR